MNVIINFVIYSDGIWLVFAIFIFMQNKGQNKTQVKLIIITYLNKIVVSHTSTIIMVYMNVLQFDVCSNCYVLVYWLSTNWEIYEMQYFRLLIGSEIQFLQLLFNCVSSGFPNAAVYATWHVSNSRLLLCCALIALVSSELRRPDCHEDAYCRERATFVGCSCSVAYVLRSH